MSVPDLPATKQHSSLTRAEISRLLAALEGAQETLQASMEGLGLAERTVRAIGLREASLSALDDRENLGEFDRLQSETNSAFRQIQMTLDIIRTEIARVKAIIISREAEIPASEAKTRSPQE